MKVQSGRPSAEGRYIVFVRCDSHQIKDWCEPELVPWDGKRWHCSKPVYCWIGPIPLMTFAEAKKHAFGKLEFDL